MSETPETIDSLRQQLRVANRIKQAAIDCTKSWDNVQDELVWERQDLDAHEIPAEHVQTMIARYPHYAADITDFATRWNADKPLTDAELADMEIDEEEALALLASDVGGAEEAVMDHVHVGLNQNEFDALLSLAFNIGGGAFARSTLLRLLNAGECEAAGAEFARWTRAGPHVLTGLVARRAEERALFLEQAA